MDPIADGIAALSFLLAGYTFWRQHRWESGQQHLQLVASQPDLVPNEIQSVPHTGRLDLNTDTLLVTLQNVGSTTPKGLYAVLFPSRIYYEQDSMPQKPIFMTPLGTYWTGAPPSAPAGSGGRCGISLNQRRHFLDGEESVIDGHFLFAPAEPRVGSPDRFYSARLTMTYRDSVERLLGEAYDLDANTREWHRVAGPTEVKEDLRELEERNRLAVTPRPVVRMPRAASDD